MIYAVIMAGGSGTRFWPASTQARPKQFLNLFGPDTMIQQTVSRLSGFIPPEQVMVITNENYREMVKAQLPGLKESYIIGEPVARNTAPCIASAASLLYEHDPEAVMVVLPADHRIGKPDEFLSVLRTAAETAQKEDSLVTIGIEPTRPETGYGYIRRENTPAARFAGREVYGVRNFTEKPTLDKAEAFLQSGDYLWNSGIFIWKVSTIVEAFKNHLAGIYEQMETLIASGKSKADIDAFYERCPSISIDYGIMEKAGKVQVVPGQFDWNDVGSWKAVHELSDKDANGNATGDSPVSLQEASGNLIYSKSGKMIALAGVDNLAVVETDNAILVVDLNKAQKVKDVVEELKKREETKRYL